MPADFPDDAPRPRLCHLIKWPDFDGYGFNLHAEKSRNSHLIGTVDENSPAELAGLRQGDFIIEVNDVNVSNENHKQVVERIKTIPSETKLLVLDAEAEKYYKSKKVVVKGTQSNVLHLKTPVPQPRIGYQPPSAPNADDNSLDERRSSSSSPRINEKSNGYMNSETFERNSRSSSTSSDALNEDRISRKSSSLDTPPTSRIDSKDNHSPTTLTPPHTPTSTDTVSSNGSRGGHGGPGHAVEPKLNLNMTASEMRAMLARQKKHDPRRESMDFRKKHAIIQDM